jgi:hypothetical protein
MHASLKGVMQPMKFLFTFPIQLNMVKKSGLTLLLQKRENYFQGIFVDQGKAG